MGGDTISRESSRCVGFSPFDERVVLPHWLTRGSSFAGGDAALAARAGGQRVLAKRLREQRLANRQFALSARPGSKHSCVHAAFATRPEPDHHVAAESERSAFPAPLKVEMLAESVDERNERKHLKTMGSNEKLRVTLTNFPSFFVTTTIVLQRDNCRKARPTWRRAKLLTIAPRATRGR